MLSLPKGRLVAKLYNAYLSLQPKLDRNCTMFAAIAKKVGSVLT